MKKIKAVAVYKLYILDGMKVNLMPKNLDHDGRIGGIENIQQKDMDESDVSTESELKQVISKLNEDKIDKHGMSPIDMNTNLTAMEKSAYHMFDALITQKFLSRSASPISQIGKRLNISIDGNKSGGRHQIVEIVGRSQDGKKSVLDKMGLSFNKPQ